MRAARPGVLTKLDIMDRGTDASAILRNEVVPLRLGYIGLVCRSQADIVARRSMRDARAAEQAFFESHSEYHEVRAGQALQRVMQVTGSWCAPCRVLPTTALASWLQHCGRARCLARHQAADRSGRPGCTSGACKAVVRAWARPADLAQTPQPTTLGLRRHRSSTGVRASAPAEPRQPLNPLRP